MSTYLRRGWYAEALSAPYSLSDTNYAFDLAKSPRLVRKDIYEGGNDVWECSEDLSTFLRSIILSSSLPSLRPQLVRDDLKVLEIGAGHGKPTLTLCRLREAHNLKTIVTLQDLNEDTLLNYAYPLFRDALNPELTKVILTPCSWGAMLTSSAETLETSVWDYDVVLSAETLYRPENFPALSDILMRILKSNSKAKALFAQKRYYFGLGGGTMPFQLYLKEQGLTQLNSEVVATLETGQSNVRDILLIG